MVTDIQLLTWIGCQNCQTSTRMSFSEWHECVKDGICPAGSDMHLGLCAKMLRDRIHFAG